MIVKQLVDKYSSSSGKLIREQLVSYFGDMFHLSDKDKTLIARAAEMIHNASAIHDDVVDEVKMAKSKKSSTQTFSNSKSVLSGDFLLAKVIAELVKAKQFEILKTLAETLQTLVEGEFLQETLKRKEDVTFTELNLLAEKKTGALLAWCCAAAAIVAKKDPETIQKCSDIGLKLGVIFELIDGSEALAKDLKEGFINSTTLHLMNLYPQLYYPIHQLKMKAFSQAPWTQDQLKVAQRKTLLLAEKLMAEMKHNLKSLDHGDSSVLFEFIEFQITRHTDSNPVLETV